MLPIAYLELRSSYQTFKSNNVALENILPKIDAQMAMSKSLSEIELWRTFRSQIMLSIVINEDRDESCN